MDPNVKLIYRAFLGGEAWDFFYSISRPEELNLTRDRWVRRWIESLANKQFMRDTEDLIKSHESRTKILI